MKTERRWMKSVLATSTEIQAVMPWTRGQRVRPQAMRPVQPRPTVIRPALAAR